MEAKEENEEHRGCTQGVLELRASWSSGDLVSRLSDGPYGASYGLLWGLIGDTKWTH